MFSNCTVITWILVSSTLKQNLTNTHQKSINCLTVFSMSMVSSYAGGPQNGTQRCVGRFFRAQSRRYTTYWAAHGGLGDHAQRIIDQRGAQVIPIRDADGFFQTIQNNVESIEEYFQAPSAFDGSSCRKLETLYVEARI